MVWGHRRSGDLRRALREALHWLDGLTGQDEHGDVSPQSALSLRVYLQREQELLGEDSIGFISFLEASGVLPPEMREMVIDRAMAASQTPLDLDDLKVIVLMVFWSRGEEPDALILDELFVAPEDRLIH